MPHISSADIAVYQSGGYDLRGFSTGLGINIEAITEKAHVLGDVWEYDAAVGMFNVSLQQNGFFTTETTGSHDAIKELMDNQVAVPTTIGMGGTTLGSFAWMIQAPLVASMDISAERGQLVKANAGFVGGGLAMGGILTGYSAGIGASTHTGAAVDGGAATTYGVYAILQVPLYDPDTATGLVFKLQGATDSGFTTPVDLITFPTVTAQHAFVFSSLGATTVHRYLRVLATWTGTPGSADAAFSVAVFRKTS